MFIRGGCAVFQGIISAYFFKTAYQKKAICLEPVVITGQKGKLCQMGLLFSPFVVF